jgi:hypothetical protein
MKILVLIAASLLAGLSASPAAGDAGGHVIY